MSLQHEEERTGTCLTLAGYERNKVLLTVIVMTTRSWASFNLRHGNVGRRVHFMKFGVMINMDVTQANIQNQMLHTAKSSKLYI